MALLTLCQGGKIGEDFLTAFSVRDVFLSTEVPMRRLPFAALGLLLASQAVAQDAPPEMPPRKVGLWEIKMTMEGTGMPPQTSHQCIDAETDKLMNTFGGGMRQQMCSQQEVKRMGSGIVISSTCNMGGMTMTSVGVVTGDFDSAYTVKVTTKRQGGPSKAGPAETKMQLDAKWAGACKADQKPGDMIMPGGVKVNILDLQNMPVPGGRPPGAPKR
jgi:hypothetical protein